MKRLLILGGFFSEKSIASAATTTTASAFFASALGFDVWPWILGALGASIGQVYKPPEGRLKAITNSGISVLIGGVVSPFLASSTWLDGNFNNKDFGIYALSFTLAAIWPWVIPVTFNAFVDSVKKLPSLIGSKND